MCARERGRAEAGDDGGRSGVVDGRKMVLESSGLDPWGGCVPVTV